MKFTNAKQNTRYVGTKMCDYAAAEINNRTEFKFLARPKSLARKNNIKRG